MSHISAKTFTSANVASKPFDRSCSCSRLRGMISRDIIIHRECSNTDDLVIGCHKHSMSDRMHESGSYMLFAQRVSRNPCTVAIHAYAAIVINQSSNDTLRRQLFISCMPAPPQSKNEQACLSTLR